MLDTVAERLTQCRARSSLSFSDLNRLTKISRSHLSNTHSGTMPISTDALELLAGPYHTTVSWLRDGNPAVNVWPEFQPTDQCRRLGSAASSPGDRAVAVLRFTAERYPGHLSTDDIPRHMTVSHGLVEAIMNGTRPPTDEFLRTLSQLSGVPYAWLQIGNAESLAGLGKPDGWSVEQLRRWLEVARKAEAMGVSPDDVGSILAIMGKNKGGA